MKHIFTYSVLSTSLFAASQALPCGGAFGSNVTIDPIQKIIVSYHDGVETYIFNPYFCQTAESFGLILPVPAVLTQNPVLGQTQLYTDLATIAAPTIQTQSACDRGVGGSASTGGTKNAGTGHGDSTTVINKGQVGIFDWALLQATTTASFTNWLTTNGFPYQTSSLPVFDEYVQKSWYFIAFKVNVGTSSSGVGGNGSVGTTTSVASGQTLCGNFGPITLAFPRATDPIIPARIAAVSSSQLTWTLYSLANQRMKVRDQSTTLRFAGPIDSQSMSTYASLSPVAQAGDRLTELQATLSAATAADLVLEADPDQTDYRRTELHTVYVYCAGGSSGTGGASNTSGLGGTAGTPASGGIPSVGGSNVTGGSATLGGAPSSGGTSSAYVLLTGGVQGIGGLLATGGAATAVSATGGAATAVTATGGGATAVTATGGAATAVSATGGIATPSSTSSANAQGDTKPKDDGGCSVTGPSSSRNRLGLGLLLTMLGLGVRRRRPSRYR